MSGGGSTSRNSRAKSAKYENVYPKLKTVSSSYPKNRLKSGK